MATSAHTYEAPAIRGNVEEISGLPAELEAELSEGRRVELVRGEQVIAELQASGVEKSAHPFRDSAKAQSTLNSVQSFAVVSALTDAEVIASLQRNLSSALANVAVPAMNVAVPAIRLTMRRGYTGSSN